MRQLLSGIEQTFRAVPDARDMAMAGLSMSSFQAAIIGLNHPETFLIDGIWSPVFFGDPSKFLAGFAAVQDDLKHSFLHVHMGVDEQDSLIGRSFTIDKFLTEQDIEHEFILTPDVYLIATTWLGRVALLI